MNYTAKAQCTTATYTINGTQLLSQTIIPSGISNTTLQVNGELIIDQFFSINSVEVTMCAGSRIQVNTGVSFTINNSSVHGVNILWDQIYAKQGSTLRVTNSTFKDALYAINIEPAATTLAGAKISVTGSTFENNIIGIRLSESSIANIKYVNLFEISNNTFKYSNYLPTFNGINVSELYGIYIKNISYIKIGNLIGGYNSFIKNNIFTSLITKGIYLENVIDAIVINSTFRENSYGLEYRNDFTFPKGNLKFTGLGKFIATPSTFNSDNVAIFCSRVKVEIKNSHMTSVSQGINVWSCAGVKHNINNNSINCCQFGILMGFNYPCDFSTITNNIISVGEACNFTCTNGVSQAFGIGILDNNTSWSPTIKKDYSYIVSFNFVSVTQGYVGIIFNSINEINAFNNTVKLNTNVLSSTCPAGQISVQNYSGINATNTHKSRFTCNYVYGLGTTGANTNYQNQVSGNIGGIPTGAITNYPNGFVINQSRYNYWACNTTDLLNTGILVYSQCSPTNLLGNTFNDHQYGLRISPTGVINTSIINAGNKWNLFNSYNISGTDYSYFNENSNTSVNNFYATGYGSNLYPTNNFLIPPSFFQPTTGNPFSCLATTNNCGIVSPSPSSNLNPGLMSLLTNYQYARGVIIDSNFIDGVKYINKRFLLEELKNDSLLEANSYLSDWYDEQINSTAWRFSNLYSDYETDIKNSLIVLNDSSTLLMNISDSLHLILDSLNTLSFIENDSLLLIDLHSYINTIAFNIEVINLKIKDAVININYLDGLRNTSISNDNNSISTTEIFESNERRVNSIYLNKVVVGNFDFTPEESNDLYSIASQCPLTGGDVVFVARAIYYQVDPSKVFFDENICMQIGLNYRNSEKNISNKTSTLYPNPSSGLVNLNIPETQEPKAFYLINMLGKKNSITPKSYVSKLATFDLSNFENGFYFLQVQYSDSNISFPISISK